MAIFIKGGPGGGSGVALDGDYADPDQLGSGKSGTAPGQAKQRLAADQTWSEPLEHFAESWDETYKVSALTGREDPDDAEATVDIALVPKGSGGIQAAIPDGTAAGGNARGTYAVDLQMVRSAATQVAGNYATIGGGRNNTASGSDSTVAGGLTNTTSGTEAFVGGGELNTASGVDSLVVGGRNNTASNSYAICVGGNTNQATAINSFVGSGFQNASSGTYDVIAGGYQQTASGTYSFIGSGYQNDATSKYSSIPGGYRAKTTLVGQMAIAGSAFFADGDAQQSWVTAKVQTTDATANVEMFIGPDGNERMTIPTDTTWGFTVNIVARRADADNESAFYKLEGCIDNNAGTTALVGSVTKTVIAEDTAAWDVQASADNTNDALKLDVTGEASKTIRWVASIHLVQVTG